MKYPKKINNGIIIIIIALVHSQLFFSSKGFGQQFLNFTKSKFFRISEGMGELPAMAGKTDWPWKSMQVGDCVKFEDRKTAGLAQVRCHAHGSKTGTKFMTKTINGVMHIWRVE